MLDHRTALRLQVLHPVLLSQNNRQLNRPQSSWPTDFEGSLFNRLLCQGSGLHPQTGSPQNQWAFSFAQESWNRLAACSSGVLAVLFGSGQSPVVGYHYFQNMNQGGLCSAGAALSAFVNWLIWPSRNVIRSSAFAIRARSSSTNASLVGLARASSGGPSGASGIWINHWPPTFSPCINPLVNRRLTVFGETPKILAVSFIEYCITQRLTHGGLIKPVILGQLLPRVPKLSKYGAMASVDALWPGSGGAR